MSEVSKLLRILDEGVSGPGEELELRKLLEDVSEGVEGSADRLAGALIRHFSKLANKWEERAENIGSENKVAELTSTQWRQAAKELQEVISNIHLRLMGLV